MSENALEFKTLLRQKIIERGLAKEEELAGCTINDLEDYMKTQGVQRLPSIYIDFLLTVGKSSGNLWKRAHYKGVDLTRIKASLLNLLIAHKNPIILPDDAFVFFSEDRIVFYYFLTKNHDENPPVYMFLEVEYKHEIVDKNLSDFLLNVY